VLSLMHLSDVTGAAF